MPETVFSHGRGRTTSAGPDRLPVIQAGAENDSKRNKTQYNENSPGEGSSLETALNPIFADHD